MKYPMPKNKRMQSIITGMILGDSYFVFKKTNKNASLSINHCIAQKEYLLYKANLLKTITEVIIDDNIIVHCKGKEFPQIQIRTKVHPIYTKFRTMFIVNNKKTVSRDVLDLLTPEGIAIWYMDDGNLIIHKRKNKDGSISVKSRELCINTQGFSYDEQELIVKYFKEVYDIKFNIYKNKGYYRLVCGAIQAKKFISLIERYIVPSMLYKIDLQYK